MILNLTDIIFSNINELKAFLVENEILPHEKRCNKCGGSAKIVVYRTNERESIMYRCTRKNCQKRNNISNTKLDHRMLINTIYLLLADSNYHQLFLYHGLSSATIASIKRKLLSCYLRFLEERPVVLGGDNIIVEVDETVLSRRGIIRNPTSYDENMQDTVWIVGAIDNTNEKNFFLKRVDNRRITTITDCLRGSINLGSVLVSDGHASYPSVARNLNLVHHVVNHSLGFVGPDGTHSNNIEGFWSHLKSTMRKENGVKRINIDDWLIQYTFKRRFVLGCSREEFFGVFVAILKYYFE